MKKRGQRCSTDSISRESKSDPHLSRRVTPTNPGRLRILPVDLMGLRCSQIEAADVKAADVKAADVKAADEPRTSRGLSIMMGRCSRSKSRSSRRSIPSNTDSPQQHLGGDGPSL